MVQLKLFKETNGNKLNGNRNEVVVSTVESIEEAIWIGQKSGLFYEVRDMKSGRTIDWNEVNIKAEEDWYYDETEMIWKKRSEAESFEESQKSIFNRFFSFNNDNPLCQLSY